MGEFLAILVFAILLPLMAGYVITAIFTAVFVNRYKNFFIFLSLLSWPMLVMVFALGDNNDARNKLLLLNVVITFISLLCSVTMARHVARANWVHAILNSGFFLLAILMVSLAANDTTGEGGWAF